MRSHYLRFLAQLRLMSDQLFIGSGLGWRRAGNIRQCLGRGRLVYGRAFIISQLERAGPTGRDWTASDRRKREQL